MRLFGELELQLGDVRLPRLESARARSLLAYLLLNRDAPQSRERLAFLLWPDSTESQARTNLRHLIHTLRRTGPELDQFLDVTPQTLWWRQDTSSWVDVAAFEAAGSAASAAGISTQHELEELRRAVALYRGDLLDGCYDEWVLDVRERFRESYMAQLQRLAVILADDGQYIEAIRVGRELLRCDPLREDTYRLLMGMHAAAGDRATAVRLYHECVSTLDRELDVEPSADIRAAYVALTRSEPDGLVRPHPEPQPRRVVGSALIGREREWQRLNECWAAAEKGHSQLVLVTGEAGVGKTRLVDELAAWAAHRGAVVAAARSYPTEGQLGYGVAISWLRSADIAPHIRRGTPADLAVLGQLLPELAGEQTATATTEFGVADERRRLFESIGAMLPAPERPTMLIADDAHWCDEQTLQLVHYLVRLDPANPVLVVATARREDLDEHHPLRVLMEGLQLLEHATEIALDRLSRAETEELLRALVGPRVEPGTVDDLYTDTEGNPLFIVETVRAGWPNLNRATSVTTPKLQAVISARLRQLSGPARSMVDVAATAGREFTAPVLAEAMGLDELTLVRGLDELWRRGIVREHGIDAYDFAHGKIRDVAYDALSPATRRHNHRVIADALVRLDQRDPDAASGEIARHYDRGGQADDAVVWYRRAAAQSQRMHADDEALRLLDRARELNSATAPDDRQLDRELAILSALVTPLAATGGFASTRLAETQQRAIELGARLGVEPESSLLRSVAMTSMCHYEFDAARLAAGQLHARAVSTADRVLQVESEYLLGIGAFWNGGFDRARVHFETVIRDFEPDRRLEHLVRFGQDPRIVCLSRLANTLWFLGAATDARRVRDEALAMAVDVGHPFSRGVAFVFAAILCVDLGDLDGFREFVDALSADADHHPFAAAQDSLIGYLEVMDGRPRAGIQRIERTIATGLVDHAPGQRAAHIRFLLAGFDLADDSVGGLAAADAALRTPGTLIWEAEAHRLRAKFLAGVGAPTEDIVSELAQATAVARHIGALGPEQTIEATRAELGLTR